MSEPWWHQMLEDLKDAADSDLGAAVAMVDAAGLFDQGDLLERAELRYEFAYEVEEHWGDRVVMRRAVMIDPALLDVLTADALSVLKRGLVAMHGIGAMELGDVAVRPLPAAPDWRERRRKARDSGSGKVVTNQGTHTSVSSMVREDRLNFGSEAELRMYRALKRKQAVLDSTATIGIIPNCALRTQTNTWWPDFVVTHRGRVGAIEIDGPRHSGRAAADHSRDAFLFDAGLAIVERLPVEDTTDDATLDRLVERFLARLLTR
jgi:very-short-patch-repair endonuclease